MLEWIESRNSQFVPRVEGLLLCSSIDPVIEGRKWAEKATEKDAPYEVYFVMGLGGGYHVSALAQMHPNAEIIVIEPSRDLEKELLSRRGPLPQNVTIVAGKKVEDVKSNVFFSSGLKSIYRVLKYPTSFRLHRDYFETLEKFLLARDPEILSEHLENRPSLREFFKSLKLNSEDVSTKPLTVIDIASAIRARSKTLEREGMIWMALRELVR